MMWTFWCEYGPSARCLDRYNLIPDTDLNSVEICMLFWSIWLSIHNRRLHHVFFSCHAMLAQSYVYNLFFVTKVSPDLMNLSTIKSFLFKTARYNRRRVDILYIELEFYTCRNNRILLKVYFILYLSTFMFLVTF